MEFTFTTSIYALDCGHDAAVRSNRVAEPGQPFHCSTCDAEQEVTDIVVLA